MQRPVKQIPQKLVSVLLTLVLLMTLVPMSTLAASAEDELPKNVMIVVGDKTITKDMKEADVKLLFGEPKLETVSAFGGHALTFYGENYADYLYIETTSDGSIAAYGSVSEGFRTQRYSWGAQDDNYVNTYVRVTKSSKDKSIVGIIGYNSLSTAKRDAYNDLLTSQPYLYCKATARHTVHMFNAISCLYGRKSVTTFDEKTFDSVVQLAENGNDPYQYASAIGVGGYCIRAGYSAYYSECVNPLRFARFGINYKLSENLNCIAYIVYKKDNKLLSFLGWVNPELFKIKSVPVPLNDRERTLLARMQEHSDSCSAHAQAAETYFDEPMDISSLPIKPGKLNEDVLQSAVDFLNMVRAGGGLEPVVKNDALCEGAQAKAAYTVYLSANKISNPSPHHPPKIDGVSDEFYALCQSGGAENLYWGNALTSIIKALDDNFGDPIWCGHRYCLLSPDAAEIGIGTTSSDSMAGQGVHKTISSYGRTCDLDFVCWPSAGVTPMEALYSKTFSWTAQARKDYSFNSDTEVDVKLLNTGQTWHFDEDSQYYDIGYGMVNFFDETLTPSAGNVYEVTLHNVKDPSGDFTDYTYRSAFVTMFPEEEVVAEVTLDLEQLSVCEGETAKLNGKLSIQGGSGQTVWWESSDESVVSVSPCGLLTAKEAGTAVITAYCGESAATCAVTVKAAPYSLWGDVDGNSIVEVEDATLIQRRNAEIQTAITEAGTAAGDVDRDGELTIVDATFIQRYDAEIPTPTDVGKKRTVKP